MAATENTVFRVFEVAGDLRAPLHRYGDASREPKEVAQASCLCPKPLPTGWKPVLHFKWTLVDRPLPVSHLTRLLERVHFPHFQS